MPCCVRRYRAAGQALCQKMMSMWKEFEAECKHCTRCRADGLLDPEAFPILMEDAPRSTGILFILEAPNRDDTYNPNKKYLTVDSETDPSGRFFHDLFVRELRFPIEDLFVTNSVLCLPAKKNDKYPVTSAQQLNCEVILRRMIDGFNPLIVCPVGAKALVATQRLDNHGYKKLATSVAKATPWYMGEHFFRSIIRAVRRETRETGGLRICSVQIGVVFGLYGKG